MPFKWLDAVIPGLGSVMDEREQPGEFSVTTPVGSVSGKGIKRTAEIVAMVCLCLLFLLAYVLYEHKIDAAASQRTIQEQIKDGQRELSIVLREFTASQREMVQAQREQNCLIALPQDVREARASFCKSVSR